SAIGPSSAAASTAAGFPISADISDLSDSSPTTARAIESDGEADRWPEPAEVAEVAEPARVVRPVSGTPRSTGNGHPASRAAAFSGKLPERAGPLTLAQTINAALTDAMLAYPQMIVFG